MLKQDDTSSFISAIKREITNYKVNDR